jgi:hypothetical protein
MAMLKWIGIVLGGIVGIFLLVVVVYLIQLKVASGKVRHWDARIEALCAANDGKDVETRVYERVMAPETKEYLRGTHPNRALFVPSRSEGKSLGPQYPFVMETRVVEVLHERDPSVVKFTERIVRVSDNKILGERFRYQRAGGIPGPDPSETRNCPTDTLERSLDVQVFLNHPRHKELEKK